MHAPAGGGAPKRHRFWLVAGITLFVLGTIATVGGMFAWRTQHNNSNLPPAIFLVGAIMLVAVLGQLGRHLHVGREHAEAEAKRSHRAKDKSERRFQSLAEGSPVGILEADAELSVLYVNSRLEDIAGRPASELLGYGWVDHIHPEDRESFIALAAAAVGAPNELASQFRIVRPSGEVRSLRMLTAGLGEDALPGEEHYMATLEDITEELALAEQLRRQAFYDTLTGLPNRALFVDRLQEAQRRASRNGTGVAVLFLDVDRFKLINDSFGHKAGDVLLRQLGDRLRGIAKEGETLARLGGDEFLVLLTDDPGVREAVTLAKRIHDGFKAPFIVGGREIITSVSIGIVLPTADEDPDTVVREADAAMYRAKEEGRGRYAIFQEQFHEHSIERLNLEQQLRKGLSRHEFRVFYQPVVSLPNQQVVGAEALVRWQHPTRGLLEPGHFIGLAEDTGLIVPIGQWVFGQAMAQLHEWDIGSNAPKLESIAVNYSAAQFREPLLAIERQHMASQWEIAFDRVCVELTESVLMGTDAATSKMLEEMKAAGVEIAIDDFGTGYSSLAYLQTLPVQTLKIDRQFIDGLGTDDSKLVMVSAIIDMAHRLGLSVIAEGVEEEIQLRLLIGAGCDMAQGYYWSRPLPPSEFAAWHQAHTGPIVDAKEVLAART